MLLRIFRTNSVYNFILVPVTGILLLLGSLLTPDTFPPNDCLVCAPLFMPLFKAGMSPTVAVCINFALIMVICFQLLSINSRFNFIRERTFLPAYLFLFAALALPGLHVIQPVTFSAIFLLQAIKRLFDAYDVRKAHSHAFDAGLLTGIAGLFYLPVSLLVLLVPISLTTVKARNNWREFVNPFVGLLLTWCLTVSYYYVFQNTSQLWDILANVFQKRETTILQQWPVQAFFIYLVLITLVSSFFILTQYDEKKISSRRYFKILFFYFISSLILFTFPVVSYEIVVILTLPLSFLITNYLTFMRRRFWAELFFVILIVISVTIQFFIK